MYPKRQKISKGASRKLFKKTADRTNAKNISGARSLMRGGFHF